MDMMSIRCAVAVTNANGEPDLFFCRVECTKEQYEDGCHYRAARRAAMEASYSACCSCCWVCDENDPLWLAVRPIAEEEWADKTLVTTIQEADR